MKIKDLGYRGIRFICSFRNRIAVLLGVIGILLIVVIKIIVIIWADIGSEILTSDEYNYLDYANSMIRDFVYNSPQGMAYRPPIYSAFLALCKLATGNYILSYKIYSIILSGITLLLILAAMPDYRGLAVVLFIGLHPTYFFLYELIIAENLIMPLTVMLSIVYMKNNYSREKLFRQNIQSVDVFKHILTGVLHGIICLIRPEAIFYVVPMLMYFFFKFKKYIAVVAFSAVIGLWILRNSLLLGVFPLLSSNSAHIFYLTVFPESTGTTIYSTDDPDKFPTLINDFKISDGLNEIEKYRYLNNISWQYLGQNWKKYISQIPDRFYFLWQTETSLVNKLGKGYRFNLSDNFRYIYSLWSILWYSIFWLLFLYSIVFSKIPVWAISALGGMNLLPLLIVAEARYKIQILPIVILGMFWVKRKK